MRNFFYVSLFVTLLLSYSCSGGSAKSGNQEPEKEVKSDEVEPEKQKTKWEYSEKVNEMDDSKTHFASIEAEEELQFAFPYDGGSKVKLIIRKKSKETDVMLSISKGQFLPNIMGDENITVRFDDNKSENYSYASPSDHSSDMIFIKNTKKFVESLKKSKKLLIQCSFYDEGRPTIKFNTEAFEWDH